MLFVRYMHTYYMCWPCLSLVAAANRKDVNEMLASRPPVRQESERQISICQMKMYVRAARSGQAPLSLVALEMLAFAPAQLSRVSIVKRPVQATFCSYILACAALL